MGGKAPPPPPAPDYVALAKNQAELDKANAEYQTKANRPDQINPYGGTQWYQDPNDPDKWTQVEYLNPDAQATLTAQQQSQLALANAGQGMLGRATAAVDQPFSYQGMTDVQGLNMPQRPSEASYGDYSNYDFSKLGDMPDAGFGAVQQVQDAMMSRLQPQMDQARNQEINRLKAQGITEGSPAWTQAMDTLNKSSVDARQQALLGAMGASGDLFNRAMAARQEGKGEIMSSTDLANALRTQRRTEGMQDADTALRDQLMQRATSEEDRQRQIEEATYLRQQPLNEFNAFMNGQQVQMPHFESFSQATGSKAADIFGASQMQYEDAVARNNAAMAARGNKLGGAASGAASGAAMGSMFGPYGAVAGGLIGGIGGYLGG